MARVDGVVVTRAITVPASLGAAVAPDTSLPAPPQPEATAMVRVARQAKRGMPHGRRRGARAPLVNERDISSERRAPAPG
jgi:hypothetical protein